jgi:hypothetical protein
MSSMLRSIRRKMEWTPKRPRSQEFPQVDYKALEEKMLAQIQSNSRRMLPDLPPPTPRLTTEEAREVLDRWVELIKDPAIQERMAELDRQGRVVLGAYGNVGIGTGRSPTEPAVYYPTEDGWKRVPAD